MADNVAAVTRIARVTAKTIPVSPITAAPSLTHQRELLRRDETVSEDTCGWVNGDLNTPLVCNYPYYQPCLWSPELHAVGCCGGAATTDCAWVTSCVPYSMVDNGCDSACQANYLNTVCNEAYPLCATATFGGPEGYTYLSCTDTPGPTDTMMVTYYGGNATSIAGLPRYFSDYWFGSGTATDTSTSATGTSTSTSDADLNDTLSWFSAHRTVIIGAIAGFCGLVLLLLVGCCILRRKRASRGVYRPASQAVPVYTMQAPVQEQYPMMQYRGYGSEYQGSDYGRVYVGPNK
ncbi:hypothetical protein G647_08479 [Cladophialophora carrionii CBS 160.54]|uniref:Mid2 domain-containing protein n=1 Tax=Cladophialophora carrionii CBS 160.54 TaxID=1279043 RepID=V9D0K5_9EURO|nr:uncharacterized protein G647_08479 [Cladophialophora carrionii CBS 160.54]ETI20444.1 hypothetical protein G647_08479 [Cladophialophora carrionii CBS 160.54]